MQIRAKKKIGIAKDASTVMLPEAHRDALFSQKLGEALCICFDVIMDVWNIVLFAKKEFFSFRFSSLFWVTVFDLKKSITMHLLSHY